MASALLQPGKAVLEWSGRGVREELELSGSCVGAVLELSGSCGLEVKEVQEWLCWSGLRRHQSVKDEDIS